MPPHSYLTNHFTLYTVVDTYSNQKFRLSYSSICFITTWSSRFEQFALSCRPAVSQRDSEEALFHVPCISCDCSTSHFAVQALPIRIQSRQGGVVAVRTTILTFSTSCSLRIRPYRSAGLSVRFRSFDFSAHPNERVSKWISLRPP